MRCIGTCERIMRRYHVRMIVWLCTLAGIYLTVCLVVWACQRRLVYHPDAEIESTPADVGLAYESVRLVTVDQVRLGAWYVPRENARGTTIFCHGNAGNISHRIGELVIWHDLGFNVLLFDYRGFGESEGHPSEAGTYLDADAAWDFVTRIKGEPAGRIVLAGRSLGGAVAIEAALRHAPGALVVESTFTTLPDVGQRLYGFLPVKLLMRDRYASVEKIGRIACPKVFLHGRDDELIPLRMGRRLYDAASEPKCFIETPGDHNSAGTLAGVEIVAQLDAFLRTHDL